MDCAHEGCPFPTHRRGLCRRHYRESRRRRALCAGPCGEVRVIKRRDGWCPRCSLERRGLLCESPACERFGRHRPSLGGGVLCEACAQRRRAAAAPAQVCLRCREAKGHHARGLCNSCYWRERHRS